MFHRHQLVRRATYCCFSINASKQCPVNWKPVLERLSGEQACPQTASSVTKNGSGTWKQSREKTAVDGDATVQVPCCLKTFPL